MVTAFFDKMSLFFRFNLMDAHKIIHHPFQNMLEKLGKYS